MENVNWNYYNKFEEIIHKYMSARGEGETKASQIVTAINKLVYRWYNDGDIFDNTYGLSGWANDLSSYANWLYTYVKESRVILERIYDIYSESQYENLLKDLADKLLTKNVLEQFSNVTKQGSIYECTGPFVYADDYYEEEW